MEHANKFLADRHASWCAPAIRPRRPGFFCRPHSPGRLPGHRCQQHFACGLRFAFLPRGGCVAPLQLPTGVFAITGARAHAHLTANLSLSPWSCPCTLRAASFATHLRTGAAMSFPPLVTTHGERLLRSGGRRRASALLSPGRLGSFGGCRARSRSDARVLGLVSGARA